MMYLIESLRMTATQNIVLLPFLNSRIIVINDFLDDGKTKEIEDNKKILKTYSHHSNAGCSSFSGLNLGRGSTRDTIHQSDLGLANLSLQQQGPSLSLQQGQRLNLKLNLTHLDLTDCVRLQDDCLRGILQASTFQEESHGES